MQSIEQRLQEAVRKANDAFWAEIATAYPEITTGDFGPGETHDFNTAQEQAVKTWLLLNTPSED